MKRLLRIVSIVVIMICIMPMQMAKAEANLVQELKLEYDRISEDRFKVYLYAEDFEFNQFELRLNYENVEILGYKYYKEFLDNGPILYLKDDIRDDKYVVFTGAAIMGEKHVEGVYIGEVDVRLLEDVVDLRLTDGFGEYGTYDEITLDMSTEWIPSTARPVTSEEPEPTETWDPSWTPIPTMIPTPLLESGDANADGVVNAQDALMVLRHAAKMETLPDISLGDISEDGNIDAVDALMILKKAARID